MNIANNIMLYRVGTNGNGGTVICQIQGTSASQNK